MRQPKSVTASYPASSPAGVQGDELHFLPPTASGIVVPSSNVPAEAQGHRFPRHQEAFVSLRKAFTLVELLVVIGIIALLISVLIPALQKARQQAQLVACGAQLRQIGVLLATYAGENRGFYPPLAWTSKTNSGGTATYTDGGSAELADKQCTSPQPMGLGLLAWTPRFQLTLTGGGQWQNTTAPIAKGLICPRDPYGAENRTAFGGGGWYTYNTSSYIAFFGRKAYDTVNGTSSPDVNRRDRAVGALDRDRQGTKHPAAQTMAMCRWLHGARARDAGNWTSLSGTNPFFYPHQTAPVLYADGHVVNADFTAYAQVVNIYGYPVPYYDWFTPSQVYKGKTYYRIDGFGSL